jgi:SEC-C motif-containing protein
VIPVALQQPCPCGTGATYDACCGRLHRRAAEAVTAEELMRSRYSAYAVGHTDHLFRTWHPRTRPDDIVSRLPVRPDEWVRLDVLDAVNGGPDDRTGVVEFDAHHLGPDGRTHVRHERSTFERRGGLWVYVAAEGSD